MPTATVEICTAGSVVAVSDSFTVPAGTPVSLDVIANDFINSAPGDAANLSNNPRIITPPAHGTLAWNPLTGKFDYRPNEGFCGTDTFEYELVALAHFTLRCMEFGDYYKDDLEALLPSFEFGVTAQFYAYFQGERGFQTFIWDAGSNAYVLESPPEEDPEYFCHTVRLDLYSFTDPEYEDGFNAEVLISNLPCITP